MNLKKPPQRDWNIFLNWKIFPKGIFRIEKLLISFCVQGELSFMVNGVHHILSNDRIFICNLNSILKIEHKSPNFKSYDLLLSEATINNIVPITEMHWNKKIFIGKHPILNIDSSQKNLFTNYFLLLEEQRNLSISMGDFSIEESTRLILQAMFNDLRKEREKLEFIPLYPISTKESYFLSFVKKLQQRGMHKHSVQHYANELHISTKHLNHICKQVCGRSAYRFIEEHLTENIMYSLTLTDKSVKEISNEFGFSNPSVFSKYVKRTMGDSPSNLRNNKHTLCYKKNKP